MIEFTDDTRAFDLLESAEMLGVVVPTLRKYLRDGLIYGEKIGQKVYIDEEELQRFIEERKRK